MRLGFRRAYFTHRPHGSSLCGITLPRGSYPTPFLGYLVLWLGSVIFKSRHPKKGAGYEPLGIEFYILSMNPEKELLTTMGPMGKQLGIPEQG